MTRFDHDPLRAYVASSEAEVRRADAEAQGQPRDVEVRKGDGRFGWLSRIARWLRNVIGG